MNKILILIFLLLLSASASANTFYVRQDGSSNINCTGLVDSGYSGSGINQPCAFSHPFYAIAPQGNNPTKLVGGDTLIIDGTNKAQYLIGLTAPNTSDTSKCSSNWPWDCFMRAIPSGIDSTHPTKILGKGWDTGCFSPPQLWGNERVSKILNLNGSSNIEIQCLEITDHSECLQNGPDVNSRCNRTSYPYGAWADTGLEASDSVNVFIKKVNIHGLYNGAHAARLTNWTLDTVSILSNNNAGWNGDIGAGVSSNSGTISFINSKIKYSGCGERLDGTPYNCYSQSQGGYGDALGTQQTGGDWVFDNVDISNNVSDGIDLLYHNGIGKVTIKNSIIGGNAGNQIKVATTATIDNTQVTANCDFFKGNSVTWNSSTFDNCRAGGDAVVFSMKVGAKESITNSTIKNILNIGVITIGSSCNGSESVTVDNNTTFELKPRFFDPTTISSKYYAAGATGNGDGSCATLKLITVNSASSCITDGSCSALVPSCGQTTTGTDNCGTTCSKIGNSCSNCPVCSVCQTCPPQTVCSPPTLSSVSVSINSNGKSYTLTK